MYTVATITALPCSPDHPTVIGHTHTHTLMQAYSHKHMHKQWNLELGSGGKVPANLGVPVLPLPFFPLTFTRLLSSPPFLSFSLHTLLSTLCGGHKLTAVQTVTHRQGMPHINMWRDRRRKSEGRMGEEYSWVQRQKVVHRLGKSSKTE